MMICKHLAVMAGTSAGSVAVVTSQRNVPENKNNMETAHYISGHDSFVSVGFNEDIRQVGPRGG